MAENEVGKGFVSIEPDAKGFGAKTERAVQSELSGVGKGAGKKIGGELGDGIGDGLGSSLPKAKGGVKGFVGEIGAAFAAIPLPVVAAGAAVGAFALKAVNDFQRVALESGKLHDATGLAVEDASRWIEVAADVGVGTDQLGTSFNFLFKSIGKNPEKFRELGITAIDARGQILQAIDVLNRTPEGAERAALGVQIFGRSWDEMSELIALGASEVASALDDVSGAKIIDDADLAQARGYRQSMDQLTDAIDEVALTIGQALVPALAKAFEGMAKLLNSPVIKQALDIITAGIDALGTSLTNLSDWDGTAWAEQFTGSIEDLANTMKVLDGASIAAYESALKAANPNVDLGPWNEQKAAALAVRDGMNYAAAAAWEYQQRSVAVTEGVPAQTQSLRALEDGVRNVAEQYQRAEDAANGYLTAVMATEDSALAQEVAIDRVGDSVRDLAVRWQEAATAVDNAKTPQNEMTEAQDAAADAARGLRGDVLGVASAALQAAEDQAALSGATLTAKQRADAQIGALQSLKQQYPQVGQQVDSLIAKINATPPSKTTNVTVTDNGTASQVQSAIMNINGKSVVVKAIGDFSDFDRNLAARAARAGMQVADTGMIVPGTYSQPFPVIAHGQEVILNPDQQAKVLWEIANGSMPAGGDGASVGGLTVVIERLYGTVDRAFAQELQGRLQVLERERR